jgi:hypothetical protein
MQTCLRIDYADYWKTNVELLYGTTPLLHVALGVLAVSVELNAGGKHIS